MLDNGKPQSGAADLFGTAFVHPVKPFKYPQLGILRDANAVILYGQANLLCLFLQADPDRTAGAVVFNGVFTQVIYHFTEHGILTQNGRNIALQLHGNTSFLCHWFQ